MARKTNKQKAQELVEEAGRLYDGVCDANTPKKLKAWAKSTLPKMDEAIEINPKYIAAWNYRGSAKGKLGDHQGAIDDYNKAIEIDPSVAATWNNRGMAKSILGDHQGAIDDYTKAIELNPKFARAWSERGFVKSELDDHQGAIDDCITAILLDPKDATVQINLEIARLSLNDYKSLRKERILNVVSSTIGIAISVFCIGYLVLLVYLSD